MATKTLDMNTLAAGTDVAAPTGYTKPSGSSSVNIVSLADPVATSEFFVGSSTSSNSIWRDDTVLTGALRKCFIVVGINNGSTVAPALLDASDNGYAAITSSTAGNTRLFKIVASQLGAQILPTVTKTHADLQVREIRWETGGVISMWDGATQIGSNYSDTTYTPIYAAALSRGGRIRSLTSEYTPAYAISSLTNPIEVGEPFSGACVGYTNGNGALNYFGRSVLAVIVSNTFSGVAADLQDGVVHPLLPATAVVMTLTKGAESSTITRDIPVLDNHKAVTFASVVADETKYLGYSFAQALNPLLNGDRGYFPDVNGLTIDPDGRIQCFSAMSVPLWIHRAVDNKTYLHTLIITADGVAVVFASKDFAPMATYVESNSITVVEEEPQSISIEGGEYAIDSGGGFGSWSSTENSVSEGNLIKVRQLSSRIPGRSSYCTLTIGSDQYIFTLTTAANADTGASIMIVNSNNPIEAGELFTITFDELNAADVMLITLEKGGLIFYPSIESVDSATALTARAPADLPAGTEVLARIYESKHARAVRDIA